MCSLEDVCLLKPWNVCAGRDIRDCLAYYLDEGEPEKINDLPEVTQVKMNKTGLLDSAYDVVSCKEHHLTPTTTRNSNMQTQNFLQPIRALRSQGNQLT